LFRYPEGFMPEGSHLYCDVSLPVLDAELLALGRWIAGYYCAPLGEMLRGMLERRPPSAAYAKRAVEFANEACQSAEALMR
jgi:primosomal protein N'